MHILDDILHLGVQNSYHTGPIEQNHIQSVKDQGKRSQTRHANFDQQLAERVYEIALQQMLSIMLMSGIKNNKKIKKIGIQRNRYQKFIQSVLHVWNKDGIPGKAQTTIKVVETGGHTETYIDTTKIL